MRNEAEYLQKLMPNPELIAKGYYRTANYMMAWLPFRFDRQHRLQKAIYLYDLALKAKPDYSPALYAKGLALKAKGRESAGEELLEEARRYKSDIAGDLEILQNFMKPLIAKYERQP